MDTTDTSFPSWESFLSAINLKNTVSEDTVMNVFDSEQEQVESNDEWEEQDPGDLLGPISSSEEEEGVDEEKNEEVEVNNNDMINHETP
jgi:hypothetical protein